MQRCMAVPARAFLVSPESDQKQAEVALRFVVGDRVECYMDGCFHRGTVVSLNLCNFEAAYQVILDEGSLTWAPTDSDSVIRLGRPKQGAEPRSRGRRSRSRSRSHSHSRNSARTLPCSVRSGSSQSHARSRSRSRSRDRIPSRERRSRCSRSRDRGRRDRRGCERDRGKRHKRKRDDSSDRERERQKKRKKTSPSPVETAAQPRALEPAQQEVSVELSIEDAVSRQIDACDPGRTLPGADFHDVLAEVTNIVLGVMIGGARTALDEEDRDFIRARVRTMVRPGPGASEALMVAAEPNHQNGSEQVSIPLQRLDQVVCRLDGERVGGVVREYLPPAIAVNEANAKDDGQSKPQHVVHVVVNPPDNRLIVVLEEDCHLQRTAGCDGLVCSRIPASTGSSDRSMGLRRKVTHCLTYLGRVVAV